MTKHNSKNTLNMKIPATFIIVISFLIFSCSEKTIKIACIGDSITEGYGLAIQSKTAYPVILDSILGSGYEVINSGRSATTLQKKGDFPYWICKEFSNVFSFKPDIIIIKLGTNDTKPHNWNSINYKKDYQALIDTFNTIPSKPKIYLCTPAPVFKTKWGINDSTVTKGIVPVVKKIATFNNLSIIDLYNNLKDQGMNFPDSIHPNEFAAKKMAHIISKVVEN